jgi:hypothetical protein
LAVSQPTTAAGEKAGYLNEASGLSCCKKKTTRTHHIICASLAFKDKQILKY